MIYVGLYYYYTIVRLTSSLSVIILNAFKFDITDRFGFFANPGQYFIGELKIKDSNIGRLVSLALRSGIRVEKVVDQLKGICGEHPVFQEGGMVLSIPDAISRILEKQYLMNKSNKNVKQQHSLMGEVCPDCGETVSFEEGCMVCHFCGFSKCG